MSRYPTPFGAPREFDYDESRVSSSTISRFFNAVYAWMAAGLALTAVVAWWVSTQPQLLAMIHGPVMFILFLVLIGLVITVSGAINRISATTATVLFMLYAALNGLFLSSIFLVYAHASIAAAFLVTAGTFAVVSLYGFVTKTDLTRLGGILMMALIGLIIASIVNIFFASSALYWAITYIGVLIFVGLTAYDTQKLKMIAIQTESSPELAARLSIVGALALYLDFLNLFLMILRLMGNRRN
jgi:FtsH-binding integral membrane protein